MTLLPTAGTPTAGTRAARLLAALLLAVSLPGCDLIENARDEIDDALDRPPDPVAFSSLIILDVPLPPDEDDSGPDLLIEIQNAAGGAVYQASSVVEDASAGVLPYVVEGGELTGTTRTYAVAVLDRDPDGYDGVAFSNSFSADDLRGSPSDTFEVVNDAGTLRAQLILAR